MDTFSFFIEANYSKFGSWSGHIALVYAVEQLERHPIWKERPQARSYNLVLATFRNSDAVLIVHPFPDERGDYTVLR